MNDTKDYHINIKTEQAGAFRILIEALKEILTEGNLIFDENGIKLMAMDSTHSILIHMKLDADNFENSDVNGMISVPSTPKFSSITNLFFKLTSYFSARHMMLHFQK